MRPDGRTVCEYHVKKIINLKDFTLTPSPAYLSTDTEIKRELECLQKDKEHAKDLDAVNEDDSYKAQVEEMRKSTFRPFGCEW